MIPPRSALDLRFILFISIYSDLLNRCRYQGYGWKVMLFMLGLIYVLFLYISMPQRQKKTWLALLRRI